MQTSRVITGFLAITLLAGLGGFCCRADDAVPASTNSVASQPAMPEECVKMLKYQLASYSYPAAYYDDVIDGVFRQFLHRWPGIPCENQVATNLAGWAAERDKVNAGQLKYRGKWYKDDDAAQWALDVRAEQLLAAQANSEQTDAETAALWKSGQFHAHSPGTPPLAEPATYCFVGQSTRNGRAYLSITFLCLDPHLDQLMLNELTGTPQLSRDDGIEVFLDTERSRTHYFQMIVNARGSWWAGEVRNQGEGRYNILAPWEPQADIRTTINKAANRWVCEILIPFDRIGGVPAKGTVWGVNFCRNFRGQGTAEDDGTVHLQSWFNVYDKSRNLHNPDLFGQFDW